ncbi:preprotein translocase subunit SecY [Kyrpidia spormannii]|uniref:Protein translocase subunit SecY n=2 Tax=Kyrpidia spormannii TaxID=2055160 RepID=A0A2K8N2D9_9BACL|nr:MULTISPECIES: preprotein translocase subunit SecY [Kyrpidia]ATY83713.1 preprotein translocase subunit SecY [Kyrpidia spormannii]MCL6575327.1 preprotein translocase subunit SecY [Kyrpidia sp.]CAB3389352.1 preprotein translocase subunit [Kyrpidia spormannii]HHY66845.1 preprotein translocase subunit SecY [Alicyclobacillus sp.]
MFQTIAGIWKARDLRNRVLFTLGILAVFRIGSFIPVPSVNATVLKQLGENPVFGLLNTFSGGALQNFSLFAMSITPYITASIIVQLLSMDVIPRFAEWAKEGEHGRRRLAQVTRYLTVVLGLIQAVGLSISFNRTLPGLIVNPGFETYALIAITLTAGTAFLMWLGEQITEKGIGNGISIIIFAGIVARLEGAVRTVYQSWFYQHPDQLFLNIVKVVLMLAGIVIVVTAVIFVQQGVRRIPVQYSKRVVGRRMYGGQTTHIPLRVNAAGVIPVIFATSLLLFPATIAQFFRGHWFADWVMTVFSYRSTTYLVLEVLLIIGFTFFYTYVQINPQQLADQMRKYSGFIPGIRPGKATEAFIIRVMNRITLAGALFLAAVTVLPILFGNLTGLNLYFGGTGLLIVTGVALETMKQIESQLLQRHYRGFIRS